MIYVTVEINKDNYLSTVVYVGNEKDKAYNFESYTEKTYHVELWENGNKKGVEIL